MRRKLCSELRTIYETSEEYPHSIRITHTMQDMVDGEMLREAVRLTMKRFPYYCVKLVSEGERLYFEENDQEMVVRNSYERCILGTEETHFHLMTLSWWKNKIHIDIHHSFADGGGLSGLMKTLLHYYCTAYYEKPLSGENVLLSDSPIDPLEWHDPYLDVLSPQVALPVKKWEGRAFQIAENPRIHLKEGCVTYNLRIPETSFLPFNFSNEGSPGTVLAMLLARCIERVNPATKNPIVIAMCINQRKALRAPKAHNSLVGCVDLVYKEAMRKMDFAMQVTCFRGYVALQSDTAQVLNEVREYQEFIADVESLPTIEERRLVCHQKMLERSQKYSATVSYVGKSDYGEAERYIQEVDILPSTALPSIETPITMEISAVNGMFFVNFIQNFEESDYYDAFVRQLRENNIEYSLLYYEKAQYPKVELF